MMHAAHAVRSPRLRSLLVALLEAGRSGATTWELTQLGLCAPGTSISELRQNGLDIVCERKKVRGRMIWRYFYRGFKAS